MFVGLKRTLPLVLASVCLAFAAATRANAQGVARGTETPLTNASVVKLVRAGFSEKTVIAIVRTRPARFDLSPDRLIELKKGGVSEKVILAMLAHDQEALISEDDLDFNDPFFKDGRGGGAEERAGRPSDPNEVNIFGSGGGSRGRTRSRGQNGGVEDDSEVTGSATVRIIRPPAEAGGAGTPKLEKTPTLTNDSIVELVEAGFSEGTIIRRIEQSPADFDLSQQKLEDLRRRRVSEPVIAAMRAAMSEGDAPASNPEN